MADAPTPRPAALRLQAARGYESVAIPFGLAAWSDEAGSATLVVIEPTEDVSTIAASLPEPAALTRGALVAIASGASGRRGLLAKLLAGSVTPISRHARATALLARGYAGIAAGIDAATGLDMVWGYAEE